MQCTELDYNHFIRDKYEEHTVSHIGRPDFLSIPDTVTTVQKSWGSIFFAEKYDTIDTCIIFVHGGVRVPTGFEHLIAVDTKENIENLATTIMLNVDLGSAVMASSLLSQLHNHPEMAIVWYDYSRVVGDANRTVLADQVPTQPYKGISPWTNAAASAESRQEILSQSLIPFFADLEELLTELSPKIIVSPHTYDPTSGGSTTPGVSDLITAGTLRPAGMIFQENQSSEPGTEFTLLPPEKLSIIQELFFTQMSKLSSLQNAVVEIGIDYPYMVPMVLPILLKTLQDADHLMFEVRKDLFESCTDEDILALTQFVLDSRQELLQ